ncbi:MAG: enoyl-CoA hydratase/isomerase family protein [Bacteroidota bacterium]
MNAFVKTELIKEGIAVITFYHPAHNSLPGDILAQLTEAITKAGENDLVKVIILKSGGDRTFCAGASFDELITINDFETGKQFFMGFANVINACRKCPKFIIGRVQGKAVGGGVGLAAAVDYCLASKYAGVKLSELAVGIGPFVVGPAVERKIGTSAFSQLTINATEFQSAQWAKEKGLYTEVFDWPEELDKAILQLADHLVNSNPEAQRMLKEVIWAGTEDWDELLEKRAEMSGRLVLSDYTKTALARFEKK